MICHFISYYDFYNALRSTELYPLSWYSYLSHCIQYKLYSNSKMFCIAHWLTVHKPVMTCTVYELVWVITALKPKCMLSAFKPILPTLYIKVNDFFTWFYNVIHLQTTDRRIIQSSSQHQYTEVTCFSSGNAPLVFFLRFYTHCTLFIVSYNVKWLHSVIYIKVR